MKLATAHLESWYRDYYFTNEIDISGSGVQDFSFAEVRELTGLQWQDLDALVFHDTASLGAPSLREAIARRWGNGNPENAMATVGSSEAIFTVMHTLLEPGDEIVVLDPCYHALVHIAEAIGCTVKRWRLRFDQGWKPDFDELKQLIHSQTRLVVVNFPHNPTGISISADQQEILLECVSAVNAYLFWDGAFTELTYQAPPLPEPTTLYRRAISISTFSKAYGLPGLRFGWCLGPADLLKRCINLLDYTTLFPSTLVELIAERVIQNADRLLDIRLTQARSNLTILKEWMEKNSDVIAWTPPMGGVTAFPKPIHHPNTNTLCHQLMKNYKLLLVPGECFYQPGHLRIGFGGKTSSLVEGLSRLSKALRSQKDLT